MADIEKDNKAKNRNFKPVKYRAWGNVTDIDAEKDNQNLVLHVDPDKIKNWEYHDRPENELGDIEALAADFKKIGQQQPCIVRPISHSHFDYELIIGERRWRAAKTAGVSLKILVRDLSDHDAALIQATENENRKDLSDFAKAKYFSKLIDKGIIQQSDIIDKLGKTKQYVSALLSYTKIPKEIEEAVGDFSLVTMFVAEKIKQLSQKSAAHIEALIELAPKISQGKIRSNKALEKEVEKLLKSTEQSIKRDRAVFSNSGQLLFTLKGNHNTMSICFPKEVKDLVEKNNETIEEVICVLQTIFEEKLMNPIK